MIELPHLGAPKVEALFLNGRSPACWQRQVSRIVARQAALTRACAWMDEVVKRPGPTLQPGPLLGGCLAELVEFPPPAQKVKETGPPRPPRSSAHSANVGRRALKERTLVPLPHSAPGKAPSLPKTAAAPSHLLHHWAGRTAVSHASPIAVPHRTRLPVESGKYAAPLPEAAQASQKWAGRIVKRARQQLMLQDMDAHLSHPDGKMETGQKGNLPKSVTSNDTMAGVLEAQWQQPLMGQTVPLPLLQKLRDGSAKTAVGESKATPASMAPTQPGREPETAVPTNLFTRSKTENVLPLFAEPNDQGRPAAPNAPTHQAVAADGPYEPLPRFAPPQLAGMLPRLRPSPPPGTTNAVPIAAATAESSGQREGVLPTLKTTAFKAAPPDDLDTLARQIKQILDEESRRHGIDV